MANTKITGKIYDWNNELYHEQELTASEIETFVSAWLFGGAVRRMAIVIDGVEITVWDADKMTYNVNELRR